LALIKRFNKRKFKKALKYFLSDEKGLDNTWLRNSASQVYLRKRNLYYQQDKKIFANIPNFSERECLNILEMANISVSKELRGKGIFKTIISLFERIARQHGYDGVLIENVLNPVIIPFLVRQSYIQSPPPMEKCFVKGFCGISPIK